MALVPLDATKLNVRPLSERHDLLEAAPINLDDWAARPLPSAQLDESIERCALRMRAARDRGAAVMLAYGAHLVKNNAGSAVCAMIEEGFVTHLATQGAGVIHDWEFAFQGRSGESVRENTPVGRFGTWDETGRWLNLAAIVGAAQGRGYGESIGRLIAEDGIEVPPAESLRQQIRDEPDGPTAAAAADLLRVMRIHKVAEGVHRVSHPFKEHSIPRAAYQRNVSMTVHPGIGYDIIVNHPLYHGAAIGRTTELDVRRFAASVDQLDGGVYLSIGSAIMSPQVFEKALSAVNNIRDGQGRPFVSDHHIVVVDLQDGGGWDWTRGEPSPENPAYYLRFCKTFARMGGTLDYLQCDNRLLLAHLLARLRAA